MPKLNQIIAIEKSAKNRINDEITKVYHVVQKPALLSGIARHYQPKHEDGDQLPSEATKVQVTAADMLLQTERLATELFDLTLTKDTANTHAKADVKIDGKAILKDVPIAHLLFLEKQMTDLHTILRSIPTLDPSESWAFQPNVNAYATQPAQTVKTKKVMKNHVKAEATDKHPAQVEVYTEDVVVGTWTTTKFSGAIPAADLAKILSRVERFQAAVKIAREEANAIEAPEKKEGAAIFSFLFRGE